MMLRYLPMLLLGWAGSSWTDAETITVEHRGAVDLAPYACQDITRSSLISRVCYDAGNRVMIVQANAVYSQYCGVAEAVQDSLLNAPSIGRYYKANITSAATKARYECAMHRGRNIDPAFAEQ
jgi:hypothetical protein